jgi:preprotein translocase subunit SecD
MNFSLSSEAAAKFATYTTDNVGSYFAIVVDGVVVSTPTVVSPIPDGRVAITVATGSDAHTAVTSLVLLLGSGSLPFPLQEVAVREVPSPSQGSAAP